MKKSIIAILVMLAAAIPSAAQARTVGTVLSTDIGTVIDGAACKTYNVDGRTFVVAEDLQGYGFDIDYNDNKRMLTIVQNPYAHRTLLTADEVNIKKEDCPVGNRVMDILSSDITVTVEGETVEAYNIDGRMVIPVRALEVCAYVEYDNEKRLVTVRGLQHYLDERYNAGNPHVTCEVKEYDDEEVVYNHSFGFPSDTEKYNYHSKPVHITETSAIDKENGTIIYYRGNPLTYGMNAGRYFRWNSYDKEIYSIQNSENEILYDADVLYRDEGELKTNSLHIITDNYAQIIRAREENYLYNYIVIDERSHNNYWPSDDEINAPDMRFEKLVGNGAIAENGFFYEIKLFDDEERYLKRYNMKSNNISRDNVLFTLRPTCGSHYFQDERRNSMFDKLISYDVEKSIDDKWILNTDGEVVYDGTVLVNSIKDIVGIIGNAACVLTYDGEVYIGDVEDFQINNQQKIAEGIKSIMGGNITIYYVNDGDELYQYDTYHKEGSKVADNIAKVVPKVNVANGNVLKRFYITTDNVLTDLEKEYVSDVKDACIVCESSSSTYTDDYGKEYYKTNYTDLIYIIKTDGTLWYYKNKDGEFARVKAFE